MGATNMNEQAPQPQPPHTKPIAELSDYLRIRLQSEKPSTVITVDFLSKMLADFEAQK